MTYIDKDNFSITFTIFTISQSLKINLIIHEMRMEIKWKSIYQLLKTFHKCWLFFYFNRKMVELTQYLP